MTDSASRDSLISPANLDTLAEYARNSPPGAFVEVGVYRGGSAVVLYRIAEEQGRMLYLYDTFTGHPDTGRNEPDHPAGRYADCADPATLRADMPRARIIPGRFPGSMDPHMGRIAFAHIDVDLYDSTYAAILALAPDMAHNGVMYFDDYGLVEGATRAIDALSPFREVLPNGKALVWY